MLVVYTTPHGAENLASFILQNEELTGAVFVFQNLNEYVEALITLKQKIINTE